MIYDNVTNMKKIQYETIYDKLIWYHIQWYEIKKCDMVGNNMVEYDVIWRNRLEYNVTHDTI